ncbi:MAG: AlpA family phage regulatory protein, partial [Rhodobacteraceae bacterium]|nr:AlpA family phage regulatory protein [Paracoccaceae bacterium]
VAAGTFPKPRKLGKRSVWSDEDLALWREQFMGSKREDLSESSGSDQ